MRTVSLPALTGESWHLMVARLFRPFRWHVWFKLLLMAWLSGQLIAGGSFNVNLPDRSEMQKLRQKEQTQLEQQEQKEQEVAHAQPDTEEEAPAPITYDQIVDSWGQIQESVRPYYWIVGLAIAAYLSISLLFLWLASRFSFVFIDAITSNSVAISEPFRRHRDVARSYFLWLIGLFAAGWAITIGVFWFFGKSLISAYAAAPQTTLITFLLDHFSWFVYFGIGFIFLFLLPWIIMWVWTTDFIVPIMHQRRCGVLSAWKAYLLMVLALPWDSTKYLLWRALLCIGIGIAYAIASLLIVLVFAIGGAIIGFLGYGLAQILPILSIPLIVVGILLLTVGIFAVSIGAWLTMLPGSVLIRTLSLRYLQSLGAGFTFFATQTQETS